MPGCLGEKSLRQGKVPRETKLVRHASCFKCFSERKPEIQDCRRPLNPFSRRKLVAPTFPETVQNVLCRSQSLALSQESVQMMTQASELGDQRCSSCFPEAEAGSGSSGAFSGSADGGSALRDFAAEPGSSSSSEKRVRAHCFEALSTQEASEGGQGTNPKVLLS